MMNPDHTDYRKLILITGANSGIGLEACKILCKEGHSIIATVRSESKGEATIQEVQSVCPNYADISYMILDTTDLKSIKEFVNKLLNEKLAGRKLDVLVNNAGMSPSPANRLLRAEGLPDVNYCMASNTAGPLIIAELLLDHMKQTAEERGESRIVFTSSSMTVMKLFSHQFHPNDVWLREDKNVPSNASLYRLSKIVLMMGAGALVEELGPDSKVKINCFCPGIVPETRLGNDYGSCLKSCYSFFARCCSCCTGAQSLEQGGEHLSSLVVRQQGESRGNFYVKGALTAPHPDTVDRENRQTVIKKVRELLRGDPDS